MKLGAFGCFIAAVTHGVTFSAICAKTDQPGWGFLAFLGAVAFLYLGSFAQFED